MTRHSYSYYIISHPLHKRGYQILKTEPGEAGIPVGEYVVFDKTEPEEVTKAKIQALQDSLNDPEAGEKKGEKAEKQYVSFQRVGAKSRDEVPEQVIFYNNSKGEQGETRRQINAVLTFAKGEVSA